MSGPGEPEASASFEYRPFEDIDLPLAARLGRFPREPDLLVDTLRAIGRRVVALLVRSLYRIEVVGSLPDGPRVALVANHGSHLDSLAVLAALPERQRRRISVFAARDYFFERWPRALLAALLGQGIAFDRSDVGELRRWAALLPRVPAGWFLVYPSGSRRSAEMHGGLLLVLGRAGWPLVPVRIEGTAAAWPVGARAPRLFRPLRVTFGEPIEAPERESLAALASFLEDRRA